MSLRTNALWLGAATALLTSCGELQPAVSTTAPQSRMPATGVIRRGSWMLPEAKGETLLYVSDPHRRKVFVYSYPQGKLVGMLEGFGTPQQECVDVSGDVWVTDFARLQVLEYAHGGTAPIRILRDAAGFPVGCAVDPRSGNLAVTNWTNPKYGRGNVAIYVKASGSPAKYKDDSLYNLWACTYDDRGNLFVDGPNGVWILAVLRQGSGSLQNVKLNQGFVAPGAVQWDGKYVAIGDERDGSSDWSLIYRVRVDAGNRGTIVRSIQLVGSDIVIQFWKHGRMVVGANCRGHDVGIWNYPSGGNATKVISRHGFGCLVGAAVSEAPSR